MQNFRIPCGDWIYPSKDSLSSVRYPIDEPLVAEIFRPAPEAGKRVAVASRISAHLCGPRFMECSWRDDKKSLRILGVKHENDQNFFENVRAEIEFDQTAVSVMRDCFSFGREWADHILFASVLLHAHLNNISLPKGIVFRKAMPPEIEAIGRW
jgi:hypothetical protein